MLTPDLNLRSQTTFPGRGVVWARDYKDSTINTLLLLLSVSLCVMNGCDVTCAIAQEDCDV